MATIYRYINLHNIFIIIMILSLLISGYVFVDRLILKNLDHTKTFNTWQFPMLLALTLDLLDI